MAATDISQYKLNHSMIRVKSPEASVIFYESLGLKLIKKLEFPDAKFDLYFLGFDSAKAASAGHARSDRQGLIELTHNYGTESDPAYRTCNGNEEPHIGYGHTCISVDNVQAACRRLEHAGFQFQQPLTAAAGSRPTAVLLDPDRYLIQIVGQQEAGETKDIPETDVGTYRMNHTMLRVKDPQTSLKFYQDVMGMTLLETREDVSKGCTCYLLGYQGPQHDNPADSTIQSKEGLLMLTWVHGSESDPQLCYHDGNSEPKGFGHIAVSVDNLEASCRRFEEQGCRWKKRLTDGRMKDVAFLLDPDGYWIEVIQNERLAGKPDAHGLGGAIESLPFVAVMC